MVNTSKKLKIMFYSWLTMISNFEYQYETQKYNINLKYCRKLDLNTFNSF